MVGLHVSRAARPQSSCGSSSDGRGITAFTLPQVFGWQRCHGPLLPCWLFGLQTLHTTDQHPLLALSQLQHFPHYTVITLLLLLLGCCFYWVVASTGLLLLLGCCFYWVVASTGLLLLLGCCFYWVVATQCVVWWSHMPACSSCLKLSWIWGGP
jgi:hypothetical protein